MRHTDRLPVPYVPPTNRSEAVDECMITGFTIPAMLAIARAFPLDGEGEETLAMMERVPDMKVYYEEAQHWLDAWGVEAKF